MAKPRWMYTIAHYFGLLCVAYISLSILFFLLSDSVLFQPPYPTQFQLSNSTLIIPSGNKKIIATYLPSRSHYTILYSHGNAEDLATLGPLLHYFQDQGFSILSYDYQGYGASDGKTSEQNTYQDIMAVYQYMIRTLKIPAQNIVLYGRSLGSGPSLYLANHKPVAGIILEAPFVSAYRTLTYYAIFPFDKYNNVAWIKNLQVPILFIHGEEDSVIKSWNTKQLAQFVRGSKYFYWVKNANHNDLLIIAGERYWVELQKFIDIIAQSQQQKH
ncbi:MAG TPA: alpha/beta hydrolase [Gammaproteobacteria bacterium]|nr:alpha/beta hydrolase [Gammaproteobacteria bacterium]